MTRRARQGTRGDERATLSAGGRGASARSGRDGDSGGAGPDERCGDHWAVQPERTRPLGPQIYARLRRAIVRGEFGPDEPIDERRIATELGVSRTPVREAVRRLVDERFVDVVAQSSTRVAPIDLALIEESRLIRRTLELESAAQAAPRMNERHVRTLCDAIRKQRRCIDERRFADAIEADDRFHHAIASVSGLERMWRTIELEKAHVDRCRHRMLPLPGEAETTLAHHERILQALRDKDAERARHAMAAHLDAAWESTRRTLRRESASRTEAAEPAQHADADEAHADEAHADQETS